MYYNFAIISILEGAAFGSTFIESLQIPHLFVSEDCITLFEATNTDDASLATDVLGRMLIADIEACSVMDDRITPLVRAAWRGNNKVLELLLDKCPVPLTELWVDQLNLATSEAARFHHWDTVERLLEFPMVVGTGALCPVAQYGPHNVLVTLLNRMPEGHDVRDALRAAYRGNHAVNAVEILQRHNRGLPATLRWPSAETIIAIWPLLDDGSKDMENLMKNSREHPGLLGRVVHLLTAAQIQDAFRIACLYDDVESVGILLYQPGVDPNATEQNAVNALIWSVALKPDGWWKSRDTFRLLIARGARSVHIRDSYGYSVRDYAATGGWLNEFNDIVGHELAQLAAAPNIVAGYIADGILDGQSQVCIDLLLACELGDTKRVEEIITEVGIKRIRNCGIERLHVTPVELAARYGHLSIVELLVGTLRSSRLTKTFALATAFNHLETVEYLAGMVLGDHFGYEAYLLQVFTEVDPARFGPAKVARVGTERLIGHSAWRGKMEHVRYLIENYPNELNNATYFAAKYNQVEIFKMLRSMGLTSLVTLGSLSYPDLSREVRECIFGSIGDANERNQRGDTALMIAATQGDIEMVEAMFSGSTTPVDIDAQNLTGMTALMHAAGNIEIVQLLLGYGADRHLMDNDKMTVEDHIIVKGGDASLLSQLSYVFK